MIIQHATAQCKRCLEQGNDVRIPVGDVTVKVWDWGTVSNLGVTPYTKGISKLVEHHDTMREFKSMGKDGVRIEDNHNDFLIFAERESSKCAVAEISVATFASEHRVRILDEELYHIFADEIRAEQRRHGFGREIF